MLADPANDKMGKILLLSYCRISINRNCSICFIQHITHIFLPASVFFLLRCYYGLGSYSIDRERRQKTVYGRHMLCMQITCELNLIASFLAAKFRRGAFSFSVAALFSHVNYYSVTFLAKLVRIALLKLQ